MNQQSPVITQGSISKSPMEQRLLNLCEEKLASLPLRVVDVDFRQGHRSLLRIFVERKLEHASPSLDECAEASRLLGTELDTQDLIPGAYDLEVSSPGLDTRLRLKEDFERVIGSEVKLKLNEAQPGIGANVRGWLREVSDTAIRVQVSGTEHWVTLDRIKQANRVWQF